MASGMGVVSGLEFQLWGCGLTSGGVAPCLEAGLLIWGRGPMSVGVASALGSAGAIRCVQVSSPTADSLPPELNDCRTGSDLNCPDAMLSPVKRLFLASRRFSRSFLSNFCKRKGHFQPQLDHRLTNAL